LVKRRPVAGNSTHFRDRAKRGERPGTRDALKEGRLKQCGKSTEGKRKSLGGEGGLAGKSGGVANSRESYSSGWRGFRGKGPNPCVQERRNKSVEG